MILKEEDVKRYFLINNDIMEDKLTDVLQEIHKTNLFDDQEESKIKDYVRKPIKLVIESYGGDCYSGMSLVNTILTSKTPVHTYCYGKAMSMGLTIYSAGHKRYAHKNTTFMQHQLSGWSYGKLKDLENEMEEKIRLQDMLDSVLVDNTIIKMSKLLDLREKKKDWFFTGSEAVDLGLVDELLDTYNRK